MREKVQVRVDASRQLGKLEHTWNYIGYDECNYTHSPGGMTLLGKIGSLEKPYYVRAHHMLCTGICHGFYKWGSTNVYTEDRNGNPVYNYETIDRMIDIWLRNNCVPFFELGFMPKDLADPREAENGASYTAGYGSVSEYQLRGWCQPPKDYNKWYELNAAQNTTEIKEAASGQEIVIVIGEQLNKEKHQTYRYHHTCENQNSSENIQFFIVWQN